MEDQKDSSNDQYVQYGDLILFEYSTQNQQKQKKGYIYSTGFLENNLYLFQQKNFSSPEENDILPLNYKAFVFQITPKLFNDYHKDYYQAKKKYEQSLKKNQHSDFIKKRLQKLEKKMAEEKKLNEKLIKKMKQQYIQYGEEIQLMHNDSKFFLSGKNDYERNDMIGYNCIIVDNFSPSMIFKIYPKFKTHKVGDKINYQDVIYLQNVTFNAFINFKEHLKDFDSVIPFSTNMLPQHNWIDQNYEKLKIFLSYEKDCVFTIKLFKKHQQATQYIYGFDYITLEHTELQALLTADVKYECNNVQKCFTYLRKYVGDFPEERFDINSVWIIEPIDNVVSEKIQVTCADQKNSFQQNIQLRHFSTGKILNILSIKNKEYAYIESKNENSLFYFKSLENNPYLLHDNLYYLAKNQDNLIFQIPKEKNTSIDVDFIGPYKRAIEEYKQLRRMNFAPLKMEDKEIKKNTIILDTKENQENILKIRLVSQQIVQKFLFIKSGILQLRQFLSNFMERQNLNEAKIIKTIQILQIIIKFIFNLNEEDSIDYFNIDLEPDQENQKLLRDMQFIDILIEIFYYSFTYYNIQDFNPKDKKQPGYEQTELILNFIKISFSAMKYAIGEYRPNELYASQWLDFLMKHTLENQDKCDTLIGQTLTELIDNNTKILESRIKQKTITDIIDGMKFDTTNLYFIDLLRAICICDNKPMFQNQKIITKNLLQEEVYRDRGFRMFIDEGEIKIETQHIKDGVPSNYIKNLTWIEEPKQSSTCLYIIKFCELLSDLCKERNYQAIKFVQNKFPKSVLLKVIKSEIYSYKIKEVMLTIFDHVWMDIEPYQVKHQPTVLIVLGENSKESHSILKPIETFDESFQELSDFVWKFLEELQPEPDLQKIKFSIKIIEILIKMIRIEFIHKPEDFMKLTQLNLNVLDLFIQSQGVVFNNITFQQKNKNKEQTYDLIQRSINQFYVKVFQLFQLILKFSIQNYSLDFVKEFHYQFQADQVKFIQLKKKKQKKEMKYFEKIYSGCMKNNSQMLHKDQLNKLILMIINFIVNQNNKDILMHSLLLMNELFKQNELFTNDFENISLIYNKNHLDIYQQLKQNCEQIFNNLENIEQWYKEEEIAVYGEKIRSMNLFLQQQKKIEFKADIKKFNQQMIRYRLLFDNKYNLEHLQKFYDNLNITQNVFKILKYDIYLQKESQDESINEFLNEIYQMIYFYQKNNSSTTEFICSNYLDIVNQHYDQSIFFAIVVLYDLILNNKNIIFQEKKNSVIIKNVIKQLNNENQNPLFFVLSLKIVNCFLDFKGFKIKKHQTLFAFKLLKNPLFIDIKRLVYKIISNENENFYQEYALVEKVNSIVVQSVNSNDNYQTKIICILDDYTYQFLAMMNTIDQCTDKNPFVQNLFQGLLDIKTFIEIYSKISLQKGLPIKCSLLKYLKNVLFANQEDELVYDSISKIWKILRTDYQSIISFLQINKGKIKIIFITIEELKTMERFFQEFFDLLIESLNLIVDIFQFHNDKSNVNDILNMKITIKSFSKELNPLICEMDLNNTNHLHLQHRIQQIMIQNQSKKDQIKDEIPMTLKQNTQLSVININLLLQNQLLDISSNEDITNQKQIEQLMAKFKNSSTFQQIKSNEYNYLIKFFNKCDQKNNMIHFNLKEFISNLINYILKEQRDNEELVNIVTKLLRTILETHSNILGDHVLSELDDDEIQNPGAIIDIQNRFSDLPIAEFTCELLKKQDFNLRTKKNLLLMAVNYLYRGNKKIQSLFLDYFQKDIKQEQIEFFSVLQKLLESCFQKIKKGIQRKNKEHLKIFYSFRDEEKEGQISIEKQNKLDKIKSKVEQFDSNYEICKLIYRFCQLLCEGHNSNLQNFLRKQSNQEDFLNINMIELAVDQWGIFIKFLNIHCYQLGQNILEFLIEAIEGPCYQNQQDVYNRKMVEYSKDLI